MAKCMETQLEDCLKEIDKMQAKINELECQLSVKRSQEPPCPDDAVQEVPVDSPLDCGNLAGYEKVVASRKNPGGTRTQMFALKKTIPAVVLTSATKTIVNNQPASDPCADVAPVASSTPGQGNKVIYMKRSHETSVYRPNQAPCPGAGTGCTCPSAPIHNEPKKPNCGWCGQNTCPHQVPSSTSQSSRGNGAERPCPPTPQERPPCGPSAQQRPPCGPNAQQKPPSGSSAQPRPSRNRTMGRVTAAERNENPFAILGTMIECADAQPQPDCPEGQENQEGRTEEEEKLEDVVNFINQEIFPILVQAVKGIIEKVDGSDVCFCLAKSLQNETDFNQAIRKYRQVSKDINCFMQDILKSLSAKLAERSKKYSPQMEMLLQGKGVVEQAEIALSEEIGRAYGREENIAGS